MPFDSDHVYAIEEKLAIGLPLSIEDDIKPVRNLVTTFYKVWLLYNEYPELNSEIDETLFRAVFDSMASKFSCSTANVSAAEEDNRVTKSTSNAEEASGDSDSTPVANNDQRTVTSVHIQCPECAEQFLLLNNDAEYAFYKHSLTPEHIEAVKSSEKLHSLSIDDDTAAASVTCPGTTSASNVSPDSAALYAASAPSLENVSTSIPFKDIIFMGGSGYTQVLNPGRGSRGGRRKEQPASTSTAAKNKDACKEDKWIQKKGNGKYCLLCDVKLPGDSQLRSHVNGQMHQQDVPWVQIHAGNRYSCTLCNASNMSLDKLYEHLDGKRHENKLDAVPETGNNNTQRQSKPSEPPKSTNFFEISVSSPVNIYRISAESRMAYFLNKICFSTEMIPSLTEIGDTSITTCSSQLSYGCNLCNAGFIQPESHMLESMHRGRVAEVLKRSDPRTVSFEQSILHGRGKKCRMCFLCNIKLPENEPMSYFRHLSSRFHLDQVKRRFRSPRFKEWERGIILRNGVPYCVFCEVILHNEDLMLEHVDNPAHTAKLE